MILMAVAVLSMTTAVAENRKAETAQVAAYDMSVNYGKLSEALGLDYDQAEAVEYIHGRFCADMRRAARASEENRPKLVHKAVKRDLSYMRHVLNERQYRTYLMLLNATFNNRDLNM